MNFKNIFSAIISLFIFTNMAISQPDYIPSSENLKTREWFQDAKFGLFIHWGIYSVLADGEWVMNQKQIDKKTYEKVAAFFNPTEFDPATWVAMVKAAGMKYITITSKHHDGFAMFDSKLTDWDIVDRTPYKKDVLRMLADECHKQGIKLFFYYSQLDWNNDNYFPLGSTGWTAGRPEGGDWNKYLDYMDGQLTELLSNYGDVAGIWFDGWWDKKDADWRLDRTYSLIHRLQPACLIGSNHHLAPKPGEDFQMFEQDLPGQNTKGHSKDSKIGNLPLETCQTMNNSWGFNLLDKKFKSTKTIIQFLVKAAGYNANLLLNVGPMPNGKIQPECVQTLKEVGQWMDKNGSTIYGTRGGPITPHLWGVTTQKDNMVYVHITNLEDNNLLLPDFGKKIKSISLFSDGTSLKFKQDAYGTAINIPADKKDDIDTILVLSL